MSSFPNPAVILNAVPDNSTITFAQFSQTVGAQIANGIAFASPETFSRSGSKITINCSKAGGTTTGPVTIDTSTEISFDATTTGAVTQVTDISGIKVSESEGSGTLKSMTITAEANGDYEVTGSVGVLFFSVPFTIVLNADGEVISSSAS